MGNDANMAAPAEYMFRGEEFEYLMNLVYITVSSGVGGGAVVDGNLLEGKNGNGVEFGHTRTGRPDYLEKYGLDERICGCGRTGCIEAYSSGNSIRDIMRTILDSKNSSGFFDNITSNFIPSFCGFEYINRFYFIYILPFFPIFRQFIQCIGISNLINIFDTEGIFIGGGVTKQGDYFFDMVRKYVDALPSLQEGVYIGPSQVGYDIGILAPFTALLKPGRYTYRLKE